MRFSISLWILQYKYRTDNISNVFHHYLYPSLPIPITTHILSLPISYDYPYPTKTEKKHTLSKWPVSNSLNQPLSNQLSSLNSALKLPEINENTFETEVIDTIEIETEEIQEIVVFETDLTQISMFLMILLCLVLIFRFLKSEKKPEAQLVNIRSGKAEKAEKVKKFEKVHVADQNEKVYRLVIDDAEC